MCGTPSVGPLIMWKNGKIRFYASYLLHAWHTHGNTLSGGADMYPLFADVDKDLQ
jgi:hypothetical protein